MACGFSEERWRTILELSEQVATLPVHERSAYLTAAGIAPEISAEVLELAAQFQEEAEQIPLPDPRLGAKVGRFLITSLLGSGGMGEVYAARDTELDRPVALKFLRPEVLGYDAGYRQFIREAQTASSLSHPNIVTIHEIVRADSTTAIVMELVEGVSLRTLCGNARESMSRIFEIGEQIASALGAAHSRGIVHRDIKPENVLMQADGHVKVLDFGLARQVSKFTGASSLHPAGTLRYLSPEQARGGAAGSASDVFSLGLVLHELATGRHAFRGDSPLETVHAILNGEPERLIPGDRIPGSFATLVESMLSKDPSQRPSADDVARRLGEIRRGVEAEPYKPEHPQQRAWTWTGAWAALLFVFIGTAAIWMKLRPVYSGPDFQNLRIRPLTSQPGWEADPALSPDGESIAFTWNDRPENPQIYVKRLDRGEIVKLTNSETGQIGALAWAPDGQRVAFKRQLPGSGGAIHTVPVAGGAESTILNLTNPNVSSAIDWSPDGERIVFSDQQPGSSQLVIYAFNLRTGEKTKLTTPPEGTWGDWSPKFSPDGKTIAFKRVTDYWLDDIYLMPAAGGPPRQLTSINAGIWGHAWTADGDSLIVSCQRGSTILGIWRFPLADPSHPERIQQGVGDLIMPATARGTNRVAWVSRQWDTNIYRSSVAGSEPPEKLIASTYRDQSPAVASDGRIAFVSDRSGAPEVWVAEADGASQVKVTNFGGPLIDNLMWSPDGQRLAFGGRRHGQAGVFTMECPAGVPKCGEPQMLIPGASAPAWSSDGTAIFYSSRRGHQYQISRHPLNGGPDTEVTSDGGSFSRETRDGQWLYFSRTDRETIYRMASPSVAAPTAAPAEPVPVEPVMDASIRALPFSWDAAPTEILFFELPAKQQRWAVRALSIASNVIRFVSERGDAYADADGMGLSVSHDGKWVYYPRVDSAGANIVVAESVQ